MKHRGDDLYRSDDTTGVDVAKNRNGLVVVGQLDDPSSLPFTKRRGGKQRCYNTISGRAMMRRVMGARTMEA
jgi:hypothetical protein